MNSVEKFRILELYSGIGGMHVAAVESEIPFEVVGSYEINTTALDVYKHNFPNIKLKGRNILSFSIDEINKLKPDIVMMSPPCQPFTRIGLKKDMEDNRTSSFIHILDLIEQMLNPPKMILLENVCGFETSQAREKLLSVLKNKNYSWQEYLVSPTQINIPNSRLRYYLLAKIDHNLPNILLSNEISHEIPFCNCCNNDECNNTINDCTNCKKRYIPSIGKLLKKHKNSIQEKMKNPNENVYSIKCFLDTLDDYSPYHLSDKTLMKYSKILDIITEDDTRSCCFTKGYGHYAEGTGSVIHHNTEKALSSVFDTEVDLKLENLKELQLRYFTPNEISRVMCFPNWFSLPSNTTNKQCYRVLGNSINPLLVSSLLLLLIKA